MQCGHAPFIVLEGPEGRKSFKPGFSQARHQGWQVHTRGSLAELQPVTRFARSCFNRMTCTWRLKPRRSHRLPCTVHEVIRPYCEQRLWLFPIAISIPPTPTKVVAVNCH